MGGGHTVRRQSGGEVSLPVDCDALAAWRKQWCQGYLPSTHGLSSRTPCDFCGRDVERPLSPQALGVKTLA